MIVFEMLPPVSWTWRDAKLLGFVLLILLGPWAVIAGLVILGWWLL